MRSLLRAAVSSRLGARNKAGRSFARRFAFGVAMAALSSRAPLQVYACRVPTPTAAPESLSALSDKDEVRIGDALCQKYRKLRGLPEASPEIFSIERYLQQVGDRVAGHAHRKLPYRFHLDPDPAFKSAVALPGGHVFIGGGILALMDREDELAIVLGHEIEHIDLRQCADRVLREQRKRHLASRDLTDLPVESFFASYTRQQELEADREGTRLAVAASYSPFGALRMFDTFKRLVGEPPAASKDSGRLTLGERISQIQSLIAAERWDSLTGERPLGLP